MMNSPCAILTTFATPQMMFSPCAITAKTQPSRMPRAASETRRAKKSAIGSLAPDLCTAVGILARGVGDARRQDDLFHAGLPLDEHHRVRNLQASRVNLELTEEVHDVHAAKLRANCRRVEAVRLLDRIGKDQQ